MAASLPPGTPFIGHGERRRHRSSFGGSLTVQNSTFTGNQAIGGNGGSGGKGPSGCL